MINITFIKNGTEFNVTGTEGQSLFDVAQSNGVPMSAGCNGNLACGQCHVIVDDAFAGILAPASSRELDVLDFVFDLETNSRLACQIILTKEMNGIRVKIP